MEKHQWIAKLALMIAWPPLALLIAAMVVLALVSAWFLIPFGAIKRKEDGGGYALTFPWAD